MLISCHVCHPSLANDNLSGLAVASRLAKYLGAAVAAATRTASSSRPGRSARSPGSRRTRQSTARIKHGLVLTCLGDPGPSTYKRSRRGDAEIDRVLAACSPPQPTARASSTSRPYGYDERQYCSPGFDLPVGCLMRTPWGQFPEYHTSADDLDFVRPEALADSFFKLLSAVAILEENRTYVNLSPYGEPQLGKRGLYRHLGGDSETPGRRAGPAVGAERVGRAAVAARHRHPRPACRSSRSAARLGVLVEHDLLSAP